MRQRLFVWLLGCLVAACSATPLVERSQVPTGDATVYVVGRGWHTDIGLPVNEVANPLAIVEGDFPGVSVLVFGFGERNYLMAHDGGSGEMLTALFPSKSAILLTALRASPSDAFGAHHVVELRVTQHVVDRIAARIWQVLEKQQDGSPLRLADGPYLGSAFYAATETYDAFHTCNTWTALVLHDAGIPVTPKGVLFASQIMDQSRHIAALQATTER